MRTLYKLDSKGKLREWRMEIDGSRYRTIAGLADGNQVTSDWTQAKAKNEGRANATTPEEQAQAEVEATYQHKLAREYHETVEGAGGGAHFFKPMLAEKYTGLPLWVDLYAQPKLDGMRCIATAKGLFSRQGKSIVAVPHIEAALAPLFEADPALIIDGELYNHDLKDDFPRLMSLCRKAKPDTEDLAESEKLVQYHIYDCPSKGEHKFATRMIYLRQLWPMVADDDIIQPLVTVQIDNVEKFNDFHGKCIAAGYEGSILRLDKPYEQKRTKSLLKRKDFLDKEFPVARTDCGEGNWSGKIKRITCIADNGEEFGATLKGSMEYAESIVGKTFKTATVRYFELTPDGIPRFGVVTALFENERDV